MWKSTFLKNFKKIVKKLGEKILLELGQIHFCELLVGRCALKGQLEMPSF